MKKQAISESRRLMIKSGIALAAGTLVSGTHAEGATQARSLRIGYQKGMLSIVRGRGTLEQRLTSLGAKVDVDNVGARFLVTLFFYIVHQIVYFTVARGLVKLTVQWSWGHEIAAALLNAGLAAVLFTLLDRFKQRA